MRTIENNTDKPVTLLLKISNAKCIGKKVTIEPKGFIIFNSEVDIIEII